MLMGKCTDGVVGLFMFERPLSKDLEVWMRSYCTQVAELKLLVVYPVPQIASRWYSTVGLSRKMYCTVLV